MREKRLTCLCLHFKELCNSFKEEKEANIITPCLKCEYKDKCNKDWLGIINPVLKEVINEEISYLSSFSFKDSKTGQSFDKQSDTSPL